ncbi:MAG: cytochrome c peroxidase [Saprospiraceae bacterium]
MRKGYVVILVVLISILSCTKDQMAPLIELDNKLRSLVTVASPNGKMSFYVLPDENDLVNVPQDPKNQLTAAKVQLGKFMFHDTGLAQDAKKPSGMGTYSCASCHNSDSGFKSGSFQGIADGGIGYGVEGENRVMDTQYEQNELDVQSARPLSLVNVGYVTNTFWNGQFGGGDVNIGTEDVWELRTDTERNALGFEGIETQNFDGLISHRISISKEILEENGYIELFDEVFGDIPEESRYTIETASFAFSAYIRTIVSNRAPFQKWLKGNKQEMSEKSKKGAILFFSKANCSNCHYSENLGSSEFHALGVNDMYQQPSYNTSKEDRRNLGRGGFTGRDRDLHKFKVPGIYNNADGDFFFHGASIKTIEELVDYKNNAVGENPDVSKNRISSKFKPLNLNDEEKSDLVHFLKYGLHDPNLDRYVPEYVPSGNCIPNSDTQSKIDLGCD